MLTIGAHLSASKGYTAMLKQAVEIGANTFQFFTRNPRGGSAKAIDENDVNEFLKLMEENDFPVILAHAPYTLNLCSAKPETREFARNTFLDDLKRMEYTPHQLYNFHPGSHTGQGAEVGIDLIAEALNKVLFPEMTTTVLLETMAGKGTEIGRSFEELRAIIDKVELDDKVGVCLDTCHVNDAGYDIVNHYDDVFAEFDRVIGLEQIAVFHVNDSLNPLGAHKDRHANIGKGTIGYDTLHRLVHDETFANVPKILETPWLCEEGSAKKTIPPYKEEIEWLLK